MIFDGRYLKGAVKISIKGPMPERFINLCMNKEITLWAISKQDGGMAAWISLKNFFKIRPLVRKSQTQVKVLSFFGLPFVIKRIKRRKMMIIGIVFFLLLLQILASHIWFIEIRGLKSLPDDKIRQIAAENGLKYASLKDKVDTKRVEKEILLNIPEISWVGIRFNGTQAFIEVVEKTIPKQENKAPANIIAQKDGVIEEIIVLSGQAAVKKGDTVRKGDILIKGILPVAPGIDVNTGGNPELSISIIPQEEVRAKGIVKAKVWYESYAEAKRMKSVSTLTGKKQTTVTLKVGDKEFSFSPSSSNPFAEYETKTVHKQFNLWRNSNFNVEVIISNHLEMVTLHEEVSFDEARDQAKIKALGIVQNNIPENAQILFRNFEVIHTADYQQSNIVRVKVNVDTIENIGEVADVKKDDGRRLF